MQCGLRRGKLVDPKAFVFNFFVFWSLRNYRTFKIFTFFSAKTKKNIEQAFLMLTRTVLKADDARKYRKTQNQKKERCVVM